MTGLSEMALHEGKAKAILFLLAVKPFTSKKKKKLLFAQTVDYLN